MDAQAETYQSSSKGFWVKKMEVQDADFPKEL